MASGRCLLETLSEKQVAVDGKNLRGSSPKSRGDKGDYLLNAWVGENGLHWHLGVTFNEGGCRVRKGFFPQKLSLLRKFALQIAKSASDKTSIKKRLFLAALDHDYLVRLIFGFKF